MATRSSLVGYCTNVHAGKELGQVVQNLEKYCDRVRQQLDDDRSLGVGLWFAEAAARLAMQPEQLTLLADHVRKFQLVPFTLNGFPQGDFHQPVVKHLVYQPTWWQPERLHYTRNLVRILSALMPPGQVGSISTLPIAWGSPLPTADQLAMAANHFVTLAEELHALFEETGKRIFIAIEPEPGCYLTDSRSLRDFFDTYLASPRLSSDQSELVRQHIGICHDVCHAAVMFEDQAAEFRKLRESGITIGKVQVSAAITVDWDDLSEPEQQQAIAQLGAFAEDRYLHQTHIRQRGQTKTEMIEDLPSALSRLQSDLKPSGTWNIHFHVPIFLERFGLLHSTQPEILRCLDLLQSRSEFVPEFTGHYEIETYAWGVLPASMREKDLSEGIAKEVNWFRALLASHTAT